MVYGYAAYHNERIKTLEIDGISALLSVPLSRFKKTKGCTTGSCHEFSLKDKGKKFIVDILDPVKMGKCTFRGFGFDDIPESKFKNELLEKGIKLGNSFLVFEKEKGKNKCIFLVRWNRCDATPLGG